MMHDESIYTDAYTFKPDRYLKDGKIDPNIQDPRDILFGFGRQCVLMTFAICTS